MTKGNNKALSKPTKQCERLAKVTKNGIAFHHAGLVQKQRSLIEDEFRKGVNQNDRDNSKSRQATV